MRSKVVDSVSTCTGAYTPSQRAKNDPEYRKQIEDSNINRVESWIKSKDMASITAFRKGLMYVHDPKNTLMDKEVWDPRKGAVPKGDPRYAYSKAENRERNRSLKTYLLSKGYGVTSIMGLYTGTDQPTEKEELFLVVNLHDDPNFKENLAKISEWFNQDSFLYKPKGSDEATIVNTNDKGGYGTEFNVGPFRDNVKAENMSRIGNTGFAFAYQGDYEPEPKEERKSWRDRKDERIENQVKDSVVVMDEFRIPEKAIKYLICKEIPEGGPSARLVTSCQLRQLVNDGKLPK